MTNIYSVKNRSANAVNASRNASLLRSTEISSSNLKWTANRQSLQNLRNGWQDTGSRYKGSSDVQDFGDIQAAGP